MPRKNRRADKRKKRTLLAREQDAGIRADESLDPEKERKARDMLPVPPDDAEAGPGAVLGSSSDARLVAQYASLGVVPEQVATAVVKKCFHLLAAADNSREYARLMRVISSFRSGMAQDMLTRAQIEKLRLLRYPEPLAPERAEPDPVDAEETSDAEPIAFIEGASAKSLHETARVLADCGILDNWADRARTNGTDAERS